MPSWRRQVSHTALLQPGRQELCVTAEIALYISDIPRKGHGSSTSLPGKVADCDLEIMVRGTVVYNKSSLN